MTIGDVTNQKYKERLSNFVHKMLTVSKACCCNSSNGAGFLAFSVYKRQPSSSPVSPIFSMHTCVTMVPGTFASLKMLDMTDQDVFVNPFRAFFEVQVPFYTTARRTR